MVALSVLHLSFHWRRVSNWIGSSCQKLFKQRVLSMVATRFVCSFDSSCQKLFKQRIISIVATRFARSFHHDLPSIYCDWLRIGIAELQREFFKHTAPSMSFLLTLQSRNCLLWTRGLRRPLLYVNSRVSGFALLFWCIACLCSEHPMSDEYL